MEAFKAQLSGEKTKVSEGWAHKTHLVSLRCADGVKLCEPCVEGQIDAKVLVIPTWLPNRLLSVIFPFSGLLFQLHGDLVCVTCSKKRLTGCCTTLFGGGVLAFAG